MELLSTEGIKSAQIEGEILDRESLQSSILRHFGMQSENIPAQEKGMADLLFEVYENYQEPLSHELLFKWHHLLMQHRKDLKAVGIYRSHEDPMQIISNRYGDLKVHFEAPPSKIVQKEMDQFIDWFNSDGGESILGKASLAHVYFESIHPFEDGNGRIGRALVEKYLSKEIGHPTLIAISDTIEKRKKEYYSNLAACNRSLEATHWVEFFSEVILQAQDNSFRWIDFLMNKSKLMAALTGLTNLSFEFLSSKLRDSHTSSLPFSPLVRLTKYDFGVKKSNLRRDNPYFQGDKPKTQVINPRQEKVLIRILEEGIEGFKGGLSAENYIAITKASKATATRDLADLVEKGALVKTGQLRHTRYWLPF